jgi:hypothetical protein
VAPDLPFGCGAWDLRQLDYDPVRLVKASYDPQTQEVKLVLEFQRGLQLQDIEWFGGREPSLVSGPKGQALLLRDAVWAGTGRPPYVARFLDEDGVTIVAARPRYDGVLAGLAGQRVRLALSLPGKDLLSRTRGVVIDKLFREW